MADRIPTQRICPHEKFATIRLLVNRFQRIPFGFYINTLKTLKVEFVVQPQNQFCYELLSIPVWAPPKRVKYFEMLSQAKAYAQQHFNHQEVLTLDRLLKKNCEPGQRPNHSGYY